MDQINLEHKDEEKKLGTEIFEAESIKAARNAAQRATKQQTKGGGHFLVREKILCDGKLDTVEATGDTCAIAEEIAQRRVPPDAEVLKKHSTEASERIIEFKSFDDVAAEAEAKSKLSGRERLEKVLLDAHGRKGFLGLGRTPNSYRAWILQPAVMKLEFKAKAKIAVTIEKLPEAARCQHCGTPDSLAVVVEGKLRFFCSERHKLEYAVRSAEAKLRSMTFGLDEAKALMAESISFNAMSFGRGSEDNNKRVFQSLIAAQRLKAELHRERIERENSGSHCWRCGKPMGFNAECPGCGTLQELAASDSCADTQNMQKSR